MKSKTKYIFVIGGVLSGVGKGVTTASIGRIFKNRGFAVSAIKIDPYINVDAGTMNPVEHGEVFVTEDGDETDQDLGNYERFLETDINSFSYMTTGRVYLSVIEKERSMYYKGKCVEVVPHIPMEVIGRIKTAAAKTKAEVMVIEIGGTAGEYQNILFLEAARMMKLESPEDVAFVLVSYLPVPGHLGEMKTKPTQYASRTLNASGIQADFIIARGPDELDRPRREKLAVLCGLRSEEDVLAAPDVKSIYEIPLVLDRQRFAELLMKRLKIKARKSQDNSWDNFVHKINKINKTLKIAVVGKYFATGDYTLADSYISVINAIKHAAWHSGVQADLTWIDAEEYEKHPEKIKELGNYGALIVPGGFGTRGIEGIIKSIQYARENKLPYLGLCYGMQLATVEFSRNVLGYKDAHTVECNPKSKNLIINVNLAQAENIKRERFGGTMRLGAYDCVLKQGSISRSVYGAETISERHRHRYEFDNKYREEMEKAGMIVTGINPQSDLVEIIEIKNHPYFVGVQFHPEFKSRFLQPHPLFVGLVKAGLKKK